MKHIKRLFRYLRINDENDNLSLTNIMVVVMVVKFGAADVQSIDMAALMTVTLNYFGKKWLAK